MFALGTPVTGLAAAVLRAARTGRVGGIQAGIRGSVAILAFALAAGPAPAAEAARPFGCSAPVGRGDDEASLVKRFGRSDVAFGDLVGAEGATERGTILFPKDAAHRVEVFWLDTARRRKPTTVRVRGPKGWSFAPTEAPAAIAVGSTLAAVEAANGRPFTLTGFGWDMGGYGVDWRGGRLDKLPSGCTLSLRFDPAPNAPARSLERASGDRRLSSADAAVRAVAPTVSEVAVGWPQ